MLTGLQLRNFKAFGNELQDIPLSKITLIYGPNSGGKSSIIQALLLLRQSLRDENQFITPSGRIRPSLRPTGLINLGSYQAMLHKHEHRRDLTIGLTYKSLELGPHCAEIRIQMNFAEYYSPETHYRITLNDEKIFEADVDFHDEGGIVVTCSLLNNGDSSNYSIHYGDDEFDSFLAPITIPMRDWIAEKYGQAPATSTRERQINQALHWLKEDSSSIPREYRDSLTAHLESALDVSRDLEGATFHQEGSEIVRYDAEGGWGADTYIEDETSAVLSALDEWFLHTGSSFDRTVALTPENIPIDYEDLLHSIHYLGPLRSEPLRFYELPHGSYGPPVPDPYSLPDTARSDGEDISTGTRGEFAAQVLHESANALASVNRWFDELDIPYEIGTESMGNVKVTGEFIVIVLYPIDQRKSRTKDGKRPRLKDENGDDVVITLSDVGFGVSQILPLIIEGVASREGSIICAEQPELHLHPRLQAKLAELMIDTIRSETGKHKQWIVETHSELLIRRIQRRIREGKDGLSPEDVSVIYVDPHDNAFEGSALKALPLNSRGKFTRPWPRGFFGEAFDELYPEEEEVTGGGNMEDILKTLSPE